MDKKQKVNIDIFAVAKAARVSPSTVSRTFNHPNLVKLSTRKKIEKAVERLGYIRNRAAQTMHGKRSATVGLIVPTVNHAIFAEVIQSFSDAVSERGFTILIATHGYNLSQEYTVLRKLLEHRVDGVALIGLDHTEATYQLIDQQAVPSLAIWNYDEDSQISCVGADNKEAGRLAAEHLVALGHREIALVFPAISDNDRARGRLEGALAVLDAAGVSVPEKWRLTSQYSIAEAKSICANLLAQKERPTALFCGNDVIAQGAIYASSAAGVAVPEELSVVGIGDFPGSEELEPALTTVRIPARRIGTEAGKQMAFAIVESALDTPLRKKFKAELLVRNTTRRIT